ncbi:MAG: lytic transglycosylase domain-containing protein [Hyphomicrobiales bacterium]|nr:lytic transglycosylase domain-containing protein [Hyphomicrobiales bacterium]
MFLVPVGARAQAPAPALSRPGPAVAVSSGAARPPDVTTVAVPISNFQAALDAYKRGDSKDGDAYAALLAPGPAQVAARWMGLKSAEHDAPLAPMQAFLHSYPHWPAADWLRARIETILFRTKAPSDQIEAYFAQFPPICVVGKLALARAKISEGQSALAQALVGQVWREAALNPSLEAQIHDEFGAFLTIKDDEERAMRMFYRHNYAASLRAANHVDAAHVAWVQAAFALEHNLNANAMLAKVPPALAKSPMLQYAKIEKLQRLPQAMPAAQAMMAAPRQLSSLLNGNAWWHRRREIARALLDQHHYLEAYRLCSDHSAEGVVDRIDAEFHAGWIALEFLHDNARAERHFRALVGLAVTPMSQARGYYWLARSLRDKGDMADARDAFAKAAQFRTFYYGQLAARELNRNAGSSGASVSALAENVPNQLDAAPVPDLALQVADKLQSAGLRGLSEELWLGYARQTTSRDQVSALAQSVLAIRDPGLTLAIGKIVSERGFGRRDLSFPTFGLPAFRPLADTVRQSLLYAIVRQESAFRAVALSRAGAQGMMQLMVPTARRTAQMEKVPFDLARLSTDPAYNVQLGAAFLGLLLKEQRGSMLLTFAAYNAGGGRVRQWMAAHGDPRQAGVNKVDWVESIPIDETRNYVQRVLENLNVYEQAFRPAMPEPNHGAGQIVAGNS